ncbi:MAG TPA: DUF6265 family protein [Terriglobales bacterium]|nr:DUF6265 family protein [Terriglobales bacterium]
MKISCSVLILLLAGAAFAQEKLTGSKASQDVSLQDLEFISGHSRGDLDGGIAEELWSEPSGDSMMGVYREVKDGKIQMYEMMTIEQTAKGPVLRLKHFNAGLEGWEDKTQVWNFPLVRFASGAAVFENPDKGIRIGYRLAETGVLEATVEHTGAKKEVFRYKHSSD